MKAALMSLLRVWPTWLPKEGCCSHLLFPRHFIHMPWQVVIIPPPISMGARHYAVVFSQEDGFMPDCDHPLSQVHLGTLWFSFSYSRGGTCAKEEFAISLSSSKGGSSHVFP